MLMIGFTERYYTLWHMSPPYVVKFYNSSGQVTGAEERVDYRYIQNLSMEYNKAVEKVKQRGEPYGVDLFLRGESYFYRVKSKQKPHHMFPDTQFSFGRLQGENIMDATDVYQLERAMSQEYGGRRRVYARRRLMELGELVRHMTVIDGKKRAIYCPLNMVEHYERAAFKDSLQWGHWYEDGEKVELTLTLLEQRSFQTMYGWSTVQRFYDAQGRLFVYLGSAPKEFEKDVPTRLKATIKHDWYNDNNQTKLLRITIL